MRIPVSFFVVAAICAMPAWGADDPAVLERVNRELDQARREQAQIQDAPLDERLNLHFGGDLGLSGVYTKTANGVDFSAARADLKVYGWAELDAGHLLYVRARALHDDAFGKDLFLEKGGRFGDTRDAAYFDRFWYRLDLARALGDPGEMPCNLTAQVGRQHVRWGQGLALDGDLYAGLTEVSWEDEKAGKLSLEGLVGWTPNRDFYDFDRSRPGYYRDTDRLFWGAKLGWQDAGPLQTHLYAFVLDQRDRNDDPARAPLGFPAGVPTQFRYDSQYWGIGATGNLGLARLTYATEWVWENGHSMSSSITPAGTPVAQQQEDIRAFAGKALLAWNFLDDQRSRVEGEVLLGSGDADRFASSTDTYGGNAAGTRDRAFNAFGYARTGLLFNAPVSNLASYRLGASTSLLPNDRLRVGVDAFLFRKLDAAGAGNESVNTGADLGQELDLHFNWQILSDVSWSVHYGLFNPGAANFGSREVRHFVFTGVHYAF